MMAVGTGSVIAIGPSARPFPQSAKPTTPNVTVASCGVKWGRAMSDTITLPGAVATEIRLYLAGQADVMRVVADVKGIENLPDPDELRAEADQIEAWAALLNEPGDVEIEQEVAQAIAAYLQEQDAEQNWIDALTGSA